MAKVARKVKISLSTSISYEQTVFLSGKQIHEAIGLEKKNYPHNKIKNIEGIGGKKWYLKGLSKALSESKRTRLFKGIEPFLFHTYSLWMTFYSFLW